MCPNQSVHWRPLQAALRPAASTIPSCRTSLPGSAPISVSSACWAVLPCSSNFNPSIPRYGLTQDCVETAPTPGFTKGQMPPTPRTAVDTATPSIPVLAQRAEIENVLTSSMTLLLSDRFNRRNGKSAARRLGNGGNQCACILVSRRFEDLFDGADLDDLSASHDGDVVGDDANDT